MAEEAEVDVADIFGDFDSDVETSQASAAASTAPSKKEEVSQAGSASTDPPEKSKSEVEKDLFGDFESAEETEEQRKRSADVLPARDRARRKKRRKQAVEGLFELEAEEADGSGDEEEGSDLVDVLDDSGQQVSASSAQRLANQQEVDELAKEMDSRGDERGSRRLFGSKLDELEQKYKAMEEAEAAISGRHSGSGSSRQGGSLLGSNRVSGSGSSRHVQGGPPHVLRKDTKTYIVPDAKDPKLWCCKTFAAEKELCMSLLLKAKECFLEGKEVPIYSAFVAPHLRGYIYIEAFKDQDIRAFIRGIYGISPWQINLVPVAQMSQVFMSAVLDADIGIKAAIAKPGDWVRMKMHTYKGDLAMIEEVEDEAYMVKMKPRLDLGTPKPQTKDERKYRKRPVARWFNRHDLESLDGSFLVTETAQMTSKGYLHFYSIGVEGEFYRDGFLYKKVPVSRLLIGDAVKPQEAELADWRSAPAPSEANRPERDLQPVDDRAAMPPPTQIPRKVSKMQRQQLLEGDIVICTRGDLKNLRGEVIKAISGQPNVFVTPIGHQETFKRPMSFSVSILSKYFAVGDFVKVLDGAHKGDTGYILKVLLGPPDEEWGMQTMAIVLSSSLGEDFKVYIDLLRKTTQKAETKDESGEYHVEQMVRVDGQSFGIIVRLEGNNRAWVLMANGEKRMSTLGELEPVTLPSRKKYADMVFTIDRKGHKIRPGDIVKAPRSFLKTAPIKAEAIYMHGTQVFLKILDGIVGERAYMACNGAKCEYMYDKPDLRPTLRPTKKDDEAEEPSVTQGTISFGIQMASETSWIKPWARKHLGLEEKDTLADGAPVRITGGDYKGLRGEVRANLGEFVRVSLLCKPKLVVIGKDNIRSDEYGTGKKKRIKEVAALAAPKTPEVPMSIPAPKSPEGSTTSSRLNEEDCWDPDFLLAPPGAIGEAPVTPDALLRAPATPDALLSQAPQTPGSLIGQADGATAANIPAAGPPADGAPAAATPTGVPPPGTPTGMPPPATPQSVHAPATPQSVHAPASLAAPPSPAGSASTSHSRKRRASRLPPTRSEPHSPSVVVAGLEKVGATAVREAWLKVGVGVKFKHRERACRGWIVKVYADTVQVVHSEADIGEDRGRIPLKGSDTKPWPCSQRGDIAIVFDGPRRSNWGNVMGLEPGRVLIKAETQSSTMLGFGKQVIRVDSKDTARYSREWVKAIEEQKLASLMEGSIQASPVDGAKMPPSSPSDMEPGGNVPMQPSLAPTVDHEGDAAETALDDLMQNRPFRKDEVEEDVVPNADTGAISVGSHASVRSGLGEETPAVLRGLPPDFDRSTVVEVDTPTPRPMSTVEEETPIPTISGVMTPGLSEMGAPRYTGQVPFEAAPLTPAPGAVTPALPLGANTPMYMGGDMTPMPGGKVTPEGAAGSGEKTPFSAGEASAISEGFSGGKTPASVENVEAEKDPGAPEVTKAEATPGSAEAEASSATPGGGANADQKAEDDDLLD